ncbi:LytTR family DNA-binding domain-containing protein [bacterium]|nr:LytTR family DNA-binding domain-containing protein [bacterium]
MGMYRSILVDDEELARNRLKKLLFQVDSVDLIAEADNPFTCIELIGELNPDLLFLDIQMPGLNGFELIQQIPSNILPLIIFVTAYDQYALRAFESLAIDYLLKPVKLSQLQNSVSKLESLENRFLKHRENLPTSQRQSNPLTGYIKRFVLKMGKKWIIIEEPEVDLFFTEDKYCYLRSKGIDSIVNFTLQELEEKLDPSTFIRVHRSTIIAYKSIKSFRSLGSARFEIELIDGYKVISSRYYSHVLKKYLVG